MREDKIELLSLRERKAILLFIAILIIFAFLVPFVVSAEIIAPTPPPTEFQEINSRLTELDKKMLTLIQRQTELDLNSVHSPDFNAFVEKTKTDFETTNAKINTRTDMGGVIIIAILISAFNWMLFGILKGRGVV